MIIMRRIGFFSSVVCLLICLVILADSSGNRLKMAGLEIAFYVSVVTSIVNAFCFIFYEVTDSKPKYK